MDSKWKISSWQHPSYWTDSSRFRGKILFLLHYFLFAQTHDWHVLSVNLNIRKQRLHSNELSDYSFKFWHTPVTRNNVMYNWHTVTHCAKTKKREFLTSWAVKWWARLPNTAVSLPFLLPSGEWLKCEKLLCLRNKITNTPGNKVSADVQEDEEALIVGCESSMSAQASSLLSQTLQVNHVQVDLLGDGGRRHGVWDHTSSWPSPAINIQVSDQWQRRSDVKLKSWYRIK